MVCVSGPGLEVGFLPEPCMIALCCQNRWLWVLFLAYVLLLCKHLSLCDSMLLSPTLERKQPEDGDCMPFVLTRARRMPYVLINKYSIMKHIYYSVLWGKNGLELKMSQLRNQLHWYLLVLLSVWAKSVPNNKIIPILFLKKF